MASIGVRLVLFNDVKWYWYYYELKQAGLQVAVVRAGESEIIDPFLVALADMPPDLWIHGNEPDGHDPEAGSWMMTPDEFVTLWNSEVPFVRHAFPNTPIYTGGLINPGDWYLDKVSGITGNTIISSLHVKPDGIDIHYPYDGNILQIYKDYYGLPIGCLEWCYKGATQLQMDSWVKELESECEHHSYYCWSDGQGSPNMALFKLNNRPYSEALIIKRSYETL